MELDPLKTYTKLINPLYMSFKVFINLIFNQLYKTHEISLIF